MRADGFQSVVFLRLPQSVPLNDDPVVTHSASEDDANVISEENVVNPVEVPEGVSMYCSSPVNVRSLPGMEGEVIGSLEENERVTVTGKEGGWYEITYDGGSGYVYQDYLPEIHSRRMRGKRICWKTKWHW